MTLRETCHRRIHSHPERAGVDRASCIEDALNGVGARTMTRVRRFLCVSILLGACLSVCAAVQAAAVRRVTHTTLTGPTLANDDYHVTYTVKVAGATTGRIELDLSSLRHPAWKVIARTALGPNGIVSYTTRTITASGTYRVRAVYLGDGTHLPSSATVSWEVV